VNRRDAIVVQEQPRSEKYERRVCIEFSWCHLDMVAGFCRKFGIDERIKRPRNKDPR
jgi:hypothetical protein